MNRNFIVSLVLGTSILSQNVFAGIPYPAGELKVSKPAGIGWVIPSIRETLTENTDGKQRVPDVIKSEVFLAPNTMATFKLANKPFVYTEIGKPLAPIESRCLVYKSMLEEVKDLDGRMSLARKDLAVENQTLKTLNKSLVTARPEEKAEIREQIAAQKEYVTYLATDLKDMDLQVKAINLSSGSLGSEPGYSVYGNWTNSFKTEEAILKNANPGLNVLELPTRIVSIVPVHMGTAGSKVFSRLVIGNKDYAEGLDGIKELVYQSKNIDEAGNSEVVNENGETKVKIKLSNIMNVGTNPNALGGTLGADGNINLGMYLNASCPFLEGTASGDAISFAMIKSFSTAVFFKGRATYNLRKVYDYIKESHEGAANGGLNPFKRQIAEEVYEKIKSDGDFKFDYFCGKPNNQQCPEEEKVRDQMRAALVDMGMKLFLSSQLSLQTGDLPLPPNKLGAAVGAGVGMAYGPVAGAAAQAITDVFTSSESRQEIHQEIDVNVSEEWNKIFFSEEYMSQVINFAR